MKRRNIVKERKRFSSFLQNLELVSDEVFWTEDILDNRGDYSLRSRRLDLVGTRKNGRARRRHARGEGAPAPEGPRKSFPAPNLITWQPLRDLSKVLTEND